LPSASAALVSRSFRVHRSPRPTFVTIAKRPSWWARDSARSEGDLPLRSTVIDCDTLARRANQQNAVKLYLLT
jgi:hypothetical protein